MEDEGTPEFKKDNRAEKTKIERLVKVVHEEVTAAAGTDGASVGYVDQDGRYDTPRVLQVVVVVIVVVGVSRIGG